MNDINDSSSGKNPSSKRRVAARLASVLDCEIADNRHETGKELVAVTLGEPDGRVETVCVTLDDGSRLCRMLAALEPVKGVITGQAPLPQPQPMIPSPWLLVRSEQAVKKMGHRAYLEALKTYAPDLGAYIERQVESLRSSIRRHCPSRPAARSLERRLMTALLVTADGTRRHG